MFLRGELYCDAMRIVEVNTVPFSSRIQSIFYESLFRFAYIIVFDRKAKVIQT